MIEIATILKATQLIESWVKGDKIPLNKWICKDGEKYIGIDNESGDCWVEEFDTPLECIKWLTDYPDEAERYGESYIAKTEFLKALNKAFGVKEESNEEDL